MKCQIRGRKSLITADLMMTFLLNFCLRLGSNDYPMRRRNAIVTSRDNKFREIAIKIRSLALLQRKSREWNRKVSLRLSIAMDLLSILALVLCRSLISCVGAENARSDNKYSTTVATTTTGAYFPDMPEAIKITYIDAATLLKFDNKGEKMMGVSDDKCDNAKVNIDSRLL